MPSTSLPTRPSGAESKSSEWGHRFDELQQLVGRVGDRLGIEAEYSRVMKNTTRELRVQIPIRTDDGHLREFTGWRVHHSGARGPFKGELLFRSGLELDQLRAHAALGTWRAALLHLPFGGASGGVACDPAKLSRREFQGVTRSYTSRVELFLGPTRDVVEPGYPTKSQVMTWVVDEFGKRHGYAPAVATGKPTDLGGLPGFYAANAVGVAAVAFEAAEDFLPPSVANSTVAIVGDGAQAAETARRVADRGFLVVAVSDREAGVRRSDGLDPRALEAHLAAKRTFAGLPGSESIDPSDVLALGVDLLVCVADETPFTADNVGRVRAKAVVDAGHEPLPSAVDTILDDLGVPVVPEILAAGGPAVASWCEWTASQQPRTWTEEDLAEQVRRTMTEAYREVRARARAEGVTYRTAAYSIAMERVWRVMKLRGL